MDFSWGFIGVWKLRLRCEEALEGVGQNDSPFIEENYTLSILSEVKTRNKMSDGRT